ncbi:MAG: iron ABC transporter permease [Spirochaetes bacterium]|nr:iron ABC transporter permease [Spirochaetota bacterium]
MERRTDKWILWTGALALALCSVTVVALCTGSAGISMGGIVQVLLEGRGSPEYSIIVDVRLPRIILGIVLGGALSVAGVLLQGLFRNPLVEPYTLGISGGAALGVCLNIVLGLQSLIGVVSYPLSGFSGAVIVIILVYFLSMKKGLLKINGILLTGVMISFIASSLIMLIMALSRTENLHGIVFWIMGSLEEPNTSLILLSSVVSLAGLGASCLFSLQLNAFAVGEEEAFHLGVNTERTKKYLFFIASVLTGVSVSVAGIIGFVGLAVPHFVRMFVGGDHRILIVCSYLAGASFLVLCDTIARGLVAPMELPVGVVTGIIGGMLFVYALNKKGGLRG